MKFAILAIAASVVASVPVTSRNLLAVEFGEAPTTTQCTASTTAAITANNPGRAAGATYACNGALDFFTQDLIDDDGGCCAAYEICCQGLAEAHPAYMVTDPMGGDMTFGETVSACCTAGTQKCNDDGKTAAYGTAYMCHDLTDGEKNNACPTMCGTGTLDEHLVENALDTTGGALANMCCGEDRPCESDGNGKFTCGEKKRSWQSILFLMFFMKKYFAGFPGVMQIMTFLLLD